MKAKIFNWIRVLTLLVLMATIKEYTPTLGFIAKTVIFLSALWAVIYGHFIIGTNEGFWGISYIFIVTGYIPSLIADWSAEAWVRLFIALGMVIFISLVLHHKELTEEE